MWISIQQETTLDQPLAEEVVRLAFENAEHTNHREYLLVRELRKTSSFIPELSLVAVADTKIVGYIMFSQISVEENETKHIALALAPLAVIPEYQQGGIGTKLIETGHEKSERLGYDACIVLGSNKYYSRFGYQEAKTFGIYAPFQVNSENYMVKELTGC